MPLAQDLESGEQARLLPSQTLLATPKTGSTQQPAGASSSRRSSRRGGCIRLVPSLTPVPSLPPLCPACPASDGVLSPSPDPASYTPSYVDRWLPSIRGRPFTYQLSANLGAGLTVALINVPLSLSLAVASGASPQSGVLCAVWAGLFAALLGGSQYNIQGPTGALSGILARYVILWGPESLPLLSLSAGCAMLVAFAFSWDRYVTFLPSSVAHGFTLGVAAIIAGGQMGSAFSLPPIPASADFLENTVNYMEEIIAGQGDWKAAVVFASMWVTLFALVKRYPRVPWMVPIAVVGVLLGWMGTVGYIFPLRTLRDKYGDLSLRLFDPPALLSPPRAMVKSWDQWLAATCSIAFVGVLESLISGKIADGMTKSVMQQRQEVFATAAANIASGLAGGLPATAALARTALNIRSGASSRLAGIFNAIFTLIIAQFALPLFGYLPLCVVAALLFQVAVGMIEVKHLRHSFRIDRGAFLLTLLVAVLCLVFDPTAAIVIGAVAGMLRFSESVATGYSEVTLTRDYRTGRKLDLKSFDSAHQEDEGMVINAWRRVFGGGPSEEACNRAALIRERSKPSTLSASASSDLAADASVIYRVVGDCTYLSSLNHCQRLRRLDKGRHLVVSFRFCHYIDLDGLDALEECFAEMARARPERLVLIAAVTPNSIVASLLHKSAWFQRDFVAKGRVFDMVQEAANMLSEQARAQEPAVADGREAASVAAPRNYGLGGETAPVAGRAFSLDKDV